MGVGEKFLFISVVIAGMLAGAAIPHLAWKFLASRMRRGRLPLPFFFTGVDGLDPYLAFDRQKQRVKRQLRFLSYMAPVAIGLPVAALGWRGSSWELIMHAVFLCLLLFVALTDGWFFLVPDEVTLLGTLFFMGMRYWLSPDEWFSYFQAMFFVYVVCWLISKITGGLGVGDAKLMAMAAWVLGFVGSWIAFWLGIGVALVFASRRLLQGKRTVFREPLPFVPHLAVGMVISLLWGESLWDWYISAFFLNE